MEDRPLPPPPPLPGTMPSSFDDNQDFYNERPMQKGFRKLKEEPLVPLGAGLTVFAFVGAWRALRRGDSREANRMFRARVAAQGFTVLAMVAGSVYYSKDREKTKELRKLKEKRDAQEKHLKWIRELEARDADKALKASLDQARQKPKPGPDADATSKNSAQTGILAKVGLWPRGEDAAQKKPAAPDAKAAEPRQRDPRSSLGTIGEVIASKKKEGDGAKPSVSSKPAPDAPPAADTSPTTDGKPENKRP